MISHCCGIWKNGCRFLEIIILLIVSSLSVSLCFLAMINLYNTSSFINLCYYLYEFYTTSSFVEDVFKEDIDFIRYVKPCIYPDSTYTLTNIFNDSDGAGFMTVINLFSAFDNWENMEQFSDSNELPSLVKFRKTIEAAERFQEDDTDKGNLKAGYENMKQRVSCTADVWVYNDMNCGKYIPVWEVGQGVMHGLSNSGGICINIIGFGVSFYFGDELMRDLTLI